MLNIITDLQNPILSYIKDDPVRPEIPVEDRVGKNKFVGMLGNEDKVQALVCVSLHDFVPKTVDDLNKDTEKPDTAIFYTIWSYVPGAGRDLLLQVVDELKKTVPTIRRFVTLSPKTEMAKKFHLRNGAVLLRENSETVNYEYHC